ncbi:MAG: prepilin-type N-terminal cleavage/methylation domain-containing protein [Candidatus Riflebacteria bacterium]|nr:prepilin-type N-terminal cleavage/methylation domain-containing protein [Candidatus Riflebacteria bacterium]
MSKCSNQSARRRIFKSVRTTTSRPSPAQQTARRQRTAAAVRKGVSLIEVLVAIALLGLLVAAALQLFHGGLISGKAAEDRMRALSLAQRELEIAKQAAATSRSSLSELLAQRAFNKTYEVDSFFHVDVRVNADAKLEVNGLGARVGEAVVTVHWNRGRAEELVLSTLLDRAYY